MLQETDKQRPRRRWVYFLRREEPKVRFVINDVDDDNTFRIGECVLRIQKCESVLLRRLQTRVEICLLINTRDR